VAPLLLAASDLLLFLVIPGRKSGAWKQGGYMTKADQHMDLALEHMGRVEQKTDRMIELLESIDRRLSETTKGDSGK
jgi:hypothetical protein